MSRTAVWMLMFLPALATPGLAGEEAVEAARRHRDNHGPQILGEFVELLSIPNVSADPEGLERTATWLRDRLRERGAKADLLRLQGAPPLVFGRLDSPGARRTLGVYVHYDGQPVDPARWTHPPFEPTLYTASLESGGVPRPMPDPGEPVGPEWYLYARSAGDDKAPAMALLAALDALHEAELRPTSNLVFLFEGEEEAGSTHLGAYFERFGEQLDVDLWLICDGPVHQSRRPQLVYGVRGYSGIDLTVYGATRYLHSGHYGNWAPNPALELARLLASMKDADGKVTIGGFYDTVVPLSDAERQALAALPPIDAQLRHELGLAATEADDAPLAERLTLPSLNIRGLASATVGPSARNVIPTTAEASLDIRLVKGNDPEQMLDLVERHVASQGWTIVREEPSRETRLAHPRIVRVTRRAGYPAVRTPMDHPLAREVARAARLAAGEPIVLMPSLGGSLPLYLFTEKLGRPIVVVPIANHDDNQHAPDENLRLANLWYGIDLFATLLRM